MPQQQGPPPLLGNFDLCWKSAPTPIYTQLATTSANVRNMAMAGYARDMDHGDGDVSAPSHWIWFGAGFAVGYGTFIMMLALMLGRQMRDLPWMWEWELERTRREEEARAAAAAGRSTPPPRRPESPFLCSGPLPPP